jgi:hypothetical protein
MAICPYFAPEIKISFHLLSCFVMFKTVQLGFLLLVSFLLLPGFTPKPKPYFPKKVNAVIQAKCYGCHSIDGKSQKAKDKLMWDDLAGMAKEQQLEKIQSIQKVLEKGSMPPEKFLEKMPEKKLTDKETKAMRKWADKTAKKLSK